MQGEEDPLMKTIPSLWCAFP